MAVTIFANATLVLPDRLVHGATLEAENGRIRFAGYRLDAARSGSAIDLNGFFVVQDYVQEKAGRVSFSGHGIFGYDSAAQNYTWYWVDAMGFVPDAPARGQFEGDTLKLEKVTPRGAARYTHRLEGKTSYHFSIENSFDQCQTWQTFLTSVYRRR